MSHIIDYSIHAEGFCNINEQDEIKFGESIKYLKDLQRLQISTGDLISINFIKGLLIALQNLNQLEQFHLYLINIKDFNSDIYSKILECFKFLKNLKSLRFFQRVSTSWSHSKQLGEEIKQLTQLRKLYLSFPQYNLDKSALQCLGTGISKLVNLQYLGIFIEENEITPEGMYYFGICLSSLKSLTKLNFGINKSNIGDKGCEGLAKGFSNLKNLQKLILQIGSKNNITVKGIIYLSNSIKELVNLLKLDISIFGNPIYYDSAEALSHSFQKLAKLKRLIINIKFCDILEKEKINQQDTKCTDRIDLQNNELSLMHLSKGLNQILNLQELQIYLTENTFNLEGMKKFSQSLVSLTKLNKLEIIFNDLKIKFAVIDEIFLSFPFIKNLQKLALNFVNCQELQFQQINLLCQGIQDLNTLRELELNLGQKSIEEAGFERICQLFKNLGQIKRLFLDIKINDDKLEIKKFIKQFKYLQMLSSLDLCVEIFQNNYDQILDYSKEILQIKSILKRLVVCEISIF